MEQWFTGTCTLKQLSDFSKKVVALPSLRRGIRAIVIPASKNRRTCHCVFPKSGSVEPDETKTINGIKVSFYSGKNIGEVRWISRRQNELTAVREGTNFTLILKERVDERCFFRCMLEGNKIKFVRFKTITN